LFPTVSSPSGRGGRGDQEGARGVIQPGGSERDYEVIEACNEQGVTMVFAGQRLFKH
jgi:phosphoribosylaminoimidazolecarboxamide formyltransferase/IMP cyclohydrolase